MVRDSQEPSEERGNLSQARSDFLEGLEQRLQSLSGSVDKLRQQPDSAPARAHVLRRVHALAASAKVLGFAGMAEQLRTVEIRLASADERVDEDVFEIIHRCMQALPGLGTTVARRSLRAPPSREGAEVAIDIVPAGAAELRQVDSPVAVLVVGDAELEQLLTAGAAGVSVDVDRCAGDDHPLKRIRAAMPDVVVVDSGLLDAAALVHEMNQDPLLRALPIVTVRPDGTREDAEPQGIACSLARPLRGPELWLAVERAVQGGPHDPSALALEGEVTLGELVEHLASELRRGLLPDGGSDYGTKLALGQGSEVLAPLWGALVRMRRSISAASGGALRFPPAGPYGGIAIAPHTRPEDATKGFRQHAEGVTLRGRRVLVVDDDQQVVWFIAGLLRAAGAEVFEAHDGQRALDLALETWPDVVISDILMPGLDGLALCRELKRDIVVRDAPIVLLSWKEDLLLRLRDLGHDADGYLRKEASASSVLRTLSELLAPRAHVAARLSAGDEVRGRLDGLTPRLILQLVVEHRPDARVTLRDAAYLYEVEVREGVPRRVTRTAADGSFERGERVVAGLLGIGAGRFTVTPSESSCRDDIGASLRDMLRQPIARARAALVATQTHRLGEIERVVVELEAVERYLPAMPRQASLLLQQLADGASPAGMLRAGRLPSALLGTVLTDLARRGALTALFTAQGKDLLEVGAWSHDAEPSYSGPPSPPLFSFELSPAPPPPAASLPPATAEVDQGWSSAPPRERHEPNPDGGTGHLRDGGDEAPSSPSFAPQGGLAQDAESPVQHNPTMVAQPEPSVDLSEAVATALVRTEQPPPTEQASGAERRDGGMLSTTAPPEGSAASRSPASIPPTTGLSPSAAAKQSGPATAPGDDREDAGEDAADEPAVPRAVALEEHTAERLPTAQQHSRGEEDEREGTVRRVGAPPVRSNSGRINVVERSETQTHPGADLAIAEVSPPDGGHPEPFVPLAQRQASRGRHSAPEAVALAAIPLIKTISRRRFVVREEMGKAPGERREVASSPAALRPAVIRTVQVGPPSDEVASDRSADLNMKAPQVQVPRPSRASAVISVGPSDVQPEEEGGGQQVVDGVHPVSTPSGERPSAGAERPDELASPPAAESSSPLPKESSKPGPDGGVRVLDTAGEDEPSMPSSRPAAGESRVQEHDPSSPAALNPAKNGDPPEPAMDRETDLEADLRDEAQLRSVDAPPQPAEHGAGDGEAKDVEMPARATPVPSGGGATGAWVKNVIAMLGAGAAAFVAVWWLVPRSNAPSTTTVADAAERDSTAQVSSSTAAAPLSSAPTVAPEELAPPDGYALPPGKGLLEIETGGPHVIYVDGQFIGRGPLRYVTLDPGAHQVETKLGGDVRQDTVSLRAGIRLRLPLTQAWQKQ